MAVITSNVMTLADIASSLDPDGKPARVINLLSQSNPVVARMPYMEGNLPTGHKTTALVSQPTLQSRSFNQGVASQVSKRTQVTEVCGMYEGVSEIDARLADIGGNPDAMRMGEDRAMAQGLGQGFATKMFYGDPASDPNDFKGLAVRYGTTSTAYGAQAKNVLDGGGTGANNASIWLVTWGENTTMGIYPKGTQAGLRHEDKGKIIKWSLNNGAETSYEVYQSRWYWDAGLAVQDWRYNVRIANIDTTKVGANTASFDLLEALDYSLRLLPTIGGSASLNAAPTDPAYAIGGGRTEIYMNRTLATALASQARYSRNMYLTKGQFGAGSILAYQDVPIVVTDALLNTEAQVTSSAPV